MKLAVSVMPFDATQTSYRI